MKQEGGLTAGREPSRATWARRREGLRRAVAAPSDVAGGRSRGRWPESESLQLAGKTCQLEAR